MGSTSATEQPGDDPLEHADIGTTHTIRKSKTLHSINYTPDEFFGSDRFPDHIDIVDVELVETDDMSCGPDIKITWEGDVTKRLPRRWDYHAEPVTDAERKQARRVKWARRLITPAITLGTVVFAVFLATEVTRRAAGQMTINGEAVAAPSFASVVPSVVVLALLAWMIVYGLKGGFPRRM